MPACLPHRLTHFKQIIIFRDVHPQRMTGSHDTPLSAVPKMTDGNDVQLRQHQKLICNGKIYDIHLARRSFDARVPDGLQMMSGLCTESLQTLDKLPPLILLVFDLETDVGSRYIIRGHRLGANVFSIEPRSIRASWFTSI